MHLLFAGASSSPDLPVTTEPQSLGMEKVQELIEEKEQLSASLFQLTTRFAQVLVEIHCSVNQLDTEIKKTTIVTIMYLDMYSVQ